MRMFVILLAGMTIGAAAMAPAAPPTQELHISKECSEYTGQTPSFCTITESNLPAIPAGSRIQYYGPVIAGTFYSSSTAVLATGTGDTALGYCVVYDAATPPTGTCAFHGGSGALFGLQAVVVVSVDDKQIWHWDGSYILAPAE